MNDRITLLATALFTLFFFVTGLDDDPGIFQQNAHGGVNGAVRSGHAVSRLFQQSRQRSHASAANRRQVYIFDFIGIH